MNEKNLPIRFFSMREKDERMTEGAGDSEIPNWVDRGAIPQKQAMFATVMTGMAAKLSEKSKKNNQLPSVLSLRLNQSASAKGSRQNIASIFNDKGAINLIGVTGNDHVMVKVNSSAEATRIANKISNLRSGDKTYLGVAAIDEIVDFEPMIEDDINLDSIIKIKLINYYDKEINDLLSRTFEKSCDDNGIKCTRCKYSSKLIAYRGQGITTDQLQFLKNFEGIQSISDMPVLEIDEDAIQYAEDIAIKEPKEGVAYPVVGILDSGIAEIPHLKNWLCEDKTTSFTDDETNRGHGTFVSGIVEYGDELIGKECSGATGCKLYDATVISKYYKTMFEDEVIANIRDAISHRPDIKIWNMSIGTEITADEQEFSDYAKELDCIQDEFDVLIVKSAGNCPELPIPVSCIAVPADSVRSLVVGSIAHKKREFDRAEENCPSPFSRKGRGPSHIIKPEVVSYGGNAGVDDNGQLTESPVLSFTLDGGIIGKTGTSFSTPRVTAIAAGLQMRMGGVI